MTTPTITPELREALRGFKKIKAVRREFSEQNGESIVTTLGFTLGEKSFVLGVFYEGMYMSQDASVDLMETEKVIDALLASSLNKAVEGDTEREKQ